MEKIYQAGVTRCGRWWMIDIPEINGLTQARRLGEARQMAREFIAVDQDIEISDVDVTLKRRRATSPG